MPIIETKGSMSSQGYGQFARSNVPASAYIEDVFSTSLYTGTGATSSSIPNGIALGAGATSPGWINVLGSAGNTFFNDITVDSSGNVYGCGSNTAASAGSGQFYLVKLSSSGVLEWQRTLSSAGASVGRSVAVDSSGNVYVCGEFSTTASNDILLVKYDASGTLLWQKSLGTSGSVLDQGFAVALDSSGRPHICGYGVIGGSNQLILAQYTSSGSLNWQRSLGVNGTNDQGFGIAIDPSDGIYVSGQTVVSSSNSLLLAKYDTTGSLQWQRALGGSSQGSKVAVDSSGNAYVTGRTSNFGTTEALVAKYNSSGTLQWQRRLNPSSAAYGEGIASDASGNVYVTGYSDDFAREGFVLKYNTSGVLQWQRSLGGQQAAPLGQQELLLASAVDASGNFYAGGYLLTGTSSTYGGLIAKFPVDGSGTGIYNVGGSILNYQASPYLEQASTLTSSTTTLTSTTTTLPDGTPSLTGGTSGTTPVSVPLPLGSGLGGLVWIKSRSTAADHALYDTTRGATFQLSSNSTALQSTQSTGLTGFLPGGFSIGSLAAINTGSQTYVAWTFAEKTKFFDIVTYSGNATNRTIAHNLGSVPGCIIVKRVNNAGGWQVYHRSNLPLEYLELNTSSGAQESIGRWNDTAPTASVFSLGTDGSVNDAGGQYVAYLFAHNAGGFGASGTDNVISCGSYNGNGSASGPVVTLGWEPQWLMVKRSTGGSTDWRVIDSLRAFAVGNPDAILTPNATNTESASNVFVSPTATGFRVNTTNADFNAADSKYIYVAIRRGPMRAPAFPFSVFQPIVGSTSSPQTSFDIRVVDAVIARAYYYTNTSDPPEFGSGTVHFYDRLRNVVSGAGRALVFNSSASEASGAPTDPRFLTSFAGQGSFPINSGSDSFDMYWMLSRAPTFFDIVCYTGTGSNTTVTHNLGVVPEFMLVKNRDQNRSWYIYSSTLAPSQILQANDNGASTDNSAWNSTAPTSSVFSVGTSLQTNGSAYTYVAYLFASCPGISKIGSYTGTGSTLQVNCGFTSGARFILIKRTNAAGNWFVWDTARGLVAGATDDPYLTWNLTDPQTAANWVDPLAAGFQLTNAGSNLVNVNGGAYTFLAIA